MDCSCARPTDATSVAGPTDDCCGSDDSTLLLSTADRSLETTEWGEREEAPALPTRRSDGDSISVGSVRGDAARGGRVTPLRLLRCVGSESPASCTTAALSSSPRRGVDRSAWRNTRCMPADPTRFNIRPDAGESVVASSPACRGSSRDDGDNVDDVAAADAELPGRRRAGPGTGERPVLGADTGDRSCCGLDGVTGLGCRWLARDDDFGRSAALGDEPAAANGVTRGPQSTRRGQAGRGNSAVCTLCASTNVPCRLPVLDVGAGLPTSSSTHRRFSMSMDFLRFAKGVEVRNVLADGDRPARGLRTGGCVAGIQQKRIAH